MRNGFIHAGGGLCGARGRCAAALALLALAATPLHAATFHVDDNALNDPGPGNKAVSDPNEDGSIAHPFDSLQEAVDAAASGDDVLVLAGTYHEHVIVIGKSLGITSQQGPNQTVIQGTPQASVVTFLNVAGSTAVLEGFTIRNGRNGINCFNSSPTIRNNIVTENSGEVQGAGLRVVQGSDALIVGNIISHNVAGGAGGLMIHNASATLIGNTFAFNEALLDPGGAIICEQSNVHIEDNLFTENASFGPGGAISIGGNSQVRVTRSVIRSNRPSTRLFGSGTGGGISIGLGSGGSEIQIDNCIIAENEGGGVHIFDSSPAIRHCTIVDNQAELIAGDGIHVHGASSPQITHTIIWGNGEAVGGTSISIAFGATPIVNFCDVEDGWPGAGNINADPQLVDSGGGDWHLQPDSPCRNAGDQTFTPPRSETDIDADPRVIGTRVDIGADEFRRLGDVNADDVVNVVDLLAVIASWGPCPAAPLPCAADSDGNGLVNVLDLLIVIGNWG